MVAASKIAKTIRRSAGKSTVADLAGRATTETATAGRANALKTGARITGQYLYDRLIADDNKADLSKMDVVRLMVPLTVDEFKTVVSDFVAVAKSKVDQAITAAKEAGQYDENNPSAAVRLASGQYKTAKNHQTVMRVAYGALKFAPEQLGALGGNEQTGYQLMRELGMKALADAGLNWDGTKAETQDQLADRRRQATETKAMLAVQQEMPRKPNESRADYFARIDKAVEKRMAEMQATAHQKEVESLADRIKKLAGDNLPEVIDLILSGSSTATTPTAPAEAALH